MSVLRLVNVIGSETHGVRYRDAALFYPTVESLAYNDCHFSTFDTIILAEPYLWNEVLARRLANSGFSGLLIIEKMPISSREAFAKLRETKYPFSIHHALLRMFEDPIIEASVEHCSIQWPNLSENHMNKIDHTLPNALLFCQAQLDLTPATIRKIIYKGRTLSLTLDNGKRHVDLEIYDTADTNACVYVNGNPLRWPNYIHLIHRLFDDILSGIDSHLTNESIIDELLYIMEVTKRGYNSEYL